jgi:hypothetical protein
MPLHAGRLAARRIGLVLAVAAPLALVTLAVAPAARADEAAAAPKRATVASLEARRARFVAARDALFALAAAPAPRDLPAAHQKHHAAFVAKMRETAAGCDATAAKLAEGLAAKSPNLDELSTLSDAESLRLQQVMDREGKLYSTLSNLLKKLADTASGVVSNLK